MTDGDGDGAIRRAGACSAGTRGHGGTATARSSPNCSISEISERPRLAAAHPRRRPRRRPGPAGRRRPGRLPAARAPAGGGPAPWPSRPASVRSARASVRSAARSAVFLVFGAALWSQLLIGWQWSVILSTGSPAASPLRRLLQTPGDDAFLVVFTTGAMLALLVLAVLAALPVLATVAGRIARGREPRLIRPSAAGPRRPLFLLLAGGRHFENNWLGTGGHTRSSPAAWPRSSGRSRSS